MAFWTQHPFYLCWYLLFMFQGKIQEFIQGGSRTPGLKILKVGAICIRIFSRRRALDPEKSIRDADLDPLANIRRCMYMSSGMKF